MHAGDLAQFGHIALATLLGFIVGWEREVRGQQAGDRTFALVSLGSASFTALSVNAFPASAEKVIAGIVTGVGFIGAGLLLQRDGMLKGLTTAAAIWSVASVGVLCGAGHVFLAFGTALLTLIVLELRYIPGLRFLDARPWSERMRGDDMGD